MTIETLNLKLIPCDMNILNAAIKSNESLAKSLGAHVLENWTEFGKDPLHYALGKLSENEYEKNWLTYFPIYKQDNRLIGSCGYKGKPTMCGEVEIGYEITMAYRNRGLASEMAAALISNAFKDPKVETILAHTLCEENPSTKILKKLGFVKTQEINDPEDGIIWRWELNRS